MYVSASLHSDCRKNRKGTPVTISQAATLQLARKFIPCCRSSRGFDLPFIESTLFVGPYEIVMMLGWKIRNSSPTGRRNYLFADGAAKLRRRDAPSART